MEKYYQARNRSRVLEVRVNVVLHHNDRPYHDGLEGGCDMCKNTMIRLWRRRGKKSIKKVRFSEMTGDSEMRINIGLEGLVKEMRLKGG